MARVVVAEEAGACYGVNRALEMVEEAAREHPGQVSTLGPLIHNPAAVAALEAEGVTVAASPADAQDRILVLRTHGVTPEEELRSHALCREVIDATCPFVVRAHVAAERLVKEGRQVLVVGERGHPEVEGTLGHAPGALVIGGPDEVESLELAERVGVVVQTTQSRENLEAVVARLRERVSDLEVVDTICEATSSRQRAAGALAARADVMVVLGGRNSANTRRLAEICAASCAETHHIEGAGELKASWFANCELIGLTAGASTPQSQMDEVRQAIEAFVS